MGKMSFNLKKKAWVMIWSTVEQGGSHMIQSRVELVFFFFSFTGFKFKFKLSSPNTNTVISLFISTHLIMAHPPHVPLFFNHVTTSL